LGADPEVADRVGVARQDALVGADPHGAQPAQHERREPGGDLRDDLRAQAVEQGARPGVGAERQELRLPLDAEEAEREVADADAELRARGFERLLPGVPVVVELVRLAREEPAGVEAELDPPRAGRELGALADRDLLRGGRAGESDQGGSRRPQPRALPHRSLRGPRRRRPTIQPTSSIRPRRPARSPAERSCTRQPQPPSSGWFTPLSSSQASPTPSPSASPCIGFGVSGQLSSASGTVSLSTSTGISSSQASPAPSPSASS